MCWSNTHKSFNKELESILSQVREQVIKNGSSAIPIIEKKFNSSFSDKRIDLKQDLPEILKEIHVKLLPEQIERLQALLDFDRNGTIDYDRFIYIIRPYIQIFQKRDLKKSKSSSSKHSIFEHQSKRMVSTSIFPSPSSFPRKFDINNLEEKIPRFWHLQMSEEGEILLTEEQIKDLKKLLIDEREDQLITEYTKMMSNFIDCYTEAQKIKSLSKQYDPSNCFNPND